MTPTTVASSISEYYAAYYFRLRQLLETRAGLIDQGDPRVVCATQERPVRIVVCTDFTMVFLGANPKEPILSFPTVEIYELSGEEFQRGAGLNFVATLTSSSPFHWHRARVDHVELIANGHLPQAWSQAEATHYASETFLSLIVPYSPETEKQLFKISAAIEELDRLIQLRMDESELQAHLSNNLAILKLVFNGSEAAIKQRVGPSYVTDFSVKQGDLKLLIEIESAVHEILTKGGDVRGPVTHAFGQVHDWLSWYEDNSGQDAEDLLGGCARLEGVVIMGHTKGLDRKVKRKINRKLRHDKVQFLSWDQFVEAARDALNSLR
jgi:Domain of unknown function (DUF4263)